MTGVDVLLLIIIIVSGLLSWFRGVTRELVSLATWVVAIAVTFLYSHKFSIILPDSLGEGAGKLVASALILFFGTLLLGWAIGNLVRRFLETLKMSTIDRILGLLYGMIRGVAIIALLVLLLHLTAVPQEPWWHESLLLPRFQAIAVWLHGFLPGDLAGYFKFP